MENRIEMKLSNLLNSKLDVLMEQVHQSQNADQIQEISKAIKKG